MGEIVIEKKQRKKHVFHTIESIRILFEERGFVLISTEYKLGIKLQYICDKGHDEEIDINSFQKGVGCSKCRIVYTIENIKKLFEERGFVLVSTEYNTGDKLQCICNNGHEGLITLQYFISGTGCYKCGTEKLCNFNKTPFVDIINEFILHQCSLITKEPEFKGERNTILEFVCSKNHTNKCTFVCFKSRINKCSKCKSIKQNCPSIRKQVTIQDVQKLCDEKNFKLISTEYKGFQLPLEFLCDKGHKNSCSIYRIRKPKPCKECNGTLPITIDRIKKEAEQRGFTLLSTVYEHSQENLEFCCSKGHIGEMTYELWRRYSGCTICGIEQRTEKTKHDYDFVKKSFEEKNCILLSTEYDHIDQKLKYSCPNNHIVETTFHIFPKLKKNCIICSGHFTSGINDSVKEIILKNKLESLREVFSLEGYTLLSNNFPIGGQKIKLEYKCPNNHINKITSRDFKSGRRCPDCNTKSHGELAIKKHFDDNNITYDRETKFQDCVNIQRLPFDFYVNNDFLIEFDGIQHFNIKTFFGGEKSFKNTQRNDIIKTKYCFTNNIPLLRISYKEIKEIPELIKQFMEEIDVRDKTGPFIQFTNTSLYEHLITVCK